MFYYKSVDFVLKQIQFIKKKTFMYFLKVAPTPKNEYRDAHVVI